MHGSAGDGLLLMMLKEEMIDTAAADLQVIIDPTCRSYPTLLDQPDHWINLALIYSSSSETEAHSLIASLRLLSVERHMIQ